MFQFGLLFLLVLHAQERWKSTVKVVPKAWLQKSVGNYAESPRLNTNGTWLQLIRSCTFLLDSGVPDF